MEPVAHASILRAQSALQMALDPEQTTVGGRARDFLVCARSLATYGRQGFDMVAGEIQRGAKTRPGKEFAEKAATAITTLSEFWDSVPGRALAQAYIASIAEGSLLDQIARWGSPIPRSVHGRVVVASGTIPAAITGENMPKLVTSSSFNAAVAAVRKATAILVLSNEVARATEDEALTMVERELRTATLKAMNAEVVEQLEATGNIVEVTGTASDVQALIAEGLAAASPSTGYVVAMSQERVAALALQAQGRMSVAGGDYVPGISIVPSEITANDTAPPRLIVIPATRCAYKDEGMRLERSEEVALSMADSQDQPAQLVSLWQNNMTAIRAERWFRVMCASPIVRVY